jgi:hypothetical protein
LDFFEAQERARRRQRWLVLWYAVRMVAATLECPVPPVIAA